MPDLPVISIVTPSYNQAAFLEATIQSVLSQSYPKLEYFVYDGGSTDASPDIIRRYAQYLKDWSSGPDRGQTDAIVRGWKHATGEVVAWLNSDDYYLPGTLKRVGEEFQKDPEVMVVVGTCLILDVNDKISGEKYARNFNLIDLLTTSGSVPGQPAVFIRRQMLETVGLPDLDLHFVMDWEYWIRLALRLRPEQIKVVYEPWAVARMWPGNKTSTGVEEICREHRLVLERLFASGTLPQHLQRLQAVARAGTYIKQAFLEWQAGLPVASRRSLAMARHIFPKVVTWRQGFNLWWRTWVPYPIYQWLRKRWVRYVMQPFRALFV